MFLDTHALVFLHAGDTGQFGPTARYLMENEELLVSPMAVLELQYLHEVGKIAYDSNMIIQDLQHDLDVKIVDRHWLATSSKALTFSWTRDPFDRIIAAHALVSGERLLTRDRVILANCSWAFWD